MEFTEIQRFSNPTLDQHSYGTSTGTLQSTGSITTTAANETVFAFGQNEGATDTTRFPVTGNSGCSYIQFISASHESAIPLVFNMASP